MTNKDQVLNCDKLSTTFHLGKKETSFLGKHMHTQVHTHKHTHSYTPSTCHPRNANRDLKWTFELGNI